MLRTVEELNSYGKLISRPIKGDFTDFLTDGCHSFLPAGFRDVVVTAAEKVSEHSVHYHKEDAETYAIVKVHTKQTPKGFWTYAKNLLSTQSDRANFKRLAEHLEDVYKHGRRVNPFYPIFSKEQVKMSARSSETTPAYIVSTDPNNRKCFGVCFEDVADGVGFGDVEKSRVVFAPTAGGAGAVIQPHRNRPDPKSYLQSQSYPDAECWDESTRAEVASIIRYGVLEPCRKEDVPLDKNVTGTRFVYKLKRNKDGTIDKYKCRMVAQGYTQIWGEDFDETFAPVSQLLTVRLLLILAVQFDLRTKHLDVETAFLNSDLEHEVYVRLPEGFEIDGCRYGRLLKSLYGLKQAAHDWHRLQHDFIIAYDKRLTQSAVDPCLYFIWTEELKVLISTHVDDYVTASDSATWVDAFKGAFGKKFIVKDLGTVDHLLQMSVEWTSDCVTLSQNRLIQDMAEEFGVADAKSVLTPMVPKLVLTRSTNPVPNLPYRRLLGQLLWLARCSRPEIMYPVVYLASFSNCYDNQHFSALKRILKYLHSTQHLKLKFQKSARNISDGGGVPLVAFSDSDWGTDRNDRRSFSGSIVYLCGNPLSWSSRKQTTVALSSCEAEFYALTDVCKDILHVSHLLREIVPFAKPIVVHIDNQGAGYMAEYKVNNNRTKHIDIRYRFVREHVESGFIDLRYIPTARNIADIFTKALADKPFMGHVMTIYRCPKKSL